MLLSYNRLKELTGIEINPVELAELLTVLGLEVEEVSELNKKYDKFFTAEVLSCEKHPDADKLSLCKVSIANAEYDVVCGAPNVASGQKVVLGIAGAVVPSAGFMLENRKIRGKMSEGMICSQVELGTGEDSSGIWVLPDDTVPGTPLADYLDMNDTIIELSITPNNADCLSHLGVAREIGAHFGKSIKYPEILLKENDKPVAESAKITIQESSKCPRYSARVITGTKVTDSPEWLKNYLIKLGLRPINLPVDVTNYVLMEIGQPMHAFDLDLVAGKEIIVKNAAEGEKFITLDEKERKLDSSMLMICDAEKSVAIGGVMGGQNSEINQNTVNILLESACFDPSSVRKTSKKLALQSDSSYRFERGTDPETTILGLNLAAKLISEYGGGEIQKGIIDEYHVPIDRGTVTLRYERVSHIIGVDIPKNDIDTILSSLQFEKQSDDAISSVWKVPSFRVDISSEIDLIEDVARHYDYRKIEPQYDSVLNFGKTEVPEKLAMPRLRRFLRDYLVMRGFNEILSQNITDPASANLFSDNPVKISNPLGEEMSRMRPSMIPSLLKVIFNNIRVGTKDLAFFEFGKVFSYTDSPDVPVKGFDEQECLALAISGNNAPRQWGESERETDFYDIKGITEELFEFLRAEDVSFEPANGSEPGFTGNAMIIKSGGDKIGVFGEIDQKIARAYEVEIPVFAMIANAEKIFKIKQKPGIYHKVAPFPGMKRDLAFVVDSSVNSGDVHAVIKNNGGNLLRSVDVFDLYEGKGIAAGRKSLGYALYFSSPERTLTEPEIDNITKKLIKEIKSKFNAELRS